MVLQAPQNTGVPLAQIIRLQYLFRSAGCLRSSVDKVWKAHGKRVGKVGGERAGTETVRNDCATYLQPGDPTENASRGSRCPQRKAAAGQGRPKHGATRERLPRYENVVFAGGGNRCFWQAGFWSVAEAALDLRPSRIVAVSAGSAIACTMFSGGFEHGFNSFKHAVAGNASNFHLRNLLRKRPLFPHGGIYRNAILAGINESALSRLHQGPEILILVSCPPRWASPGVALLLAMVATGFDIWLNDAVHSTIGRRLGFEPAFIPVRECRTPESLADLIIASSCTPPLTPQARRNGVALLDGALVDNVPTGGLTEARGDTLVLLTRHFRELPSIPGRTYVQPSHPIPVAAFDYTDDRAVQSAFDLGRRDAEAFCASIAAAAGSRRSGPSRMPQPRP